jgi:hypothetical protein
MMTTQIAWVYAQLKKGRSLTPMVAMEGCGTMRLAAIIYTLREKGVNIRTTQLKTKSGHGYASYKMVKGK